MATEDMTFLLELYHIFWPQVLTKRLGPQFTVNDCFGDPDHGCVLATLTMTGS